jgi:hypothetical protein
MATPAEIRHRLTQRWPALEQAYAAFRKEAATVVAVERDLWRYPMAVSASFGKDEQSAMITRRVTLGAFRTVKPLRTRSEWSSVAVAGERAAEVVVLAAAECVAVAVSWAAEDSAVAVVSAVEDSAVAVVSAAAGSEAVLEDSAVTVSSFSIGDSVMDLVEAFGDGQAGAGAAGGVD